MRVIAVTRVADCNDDMRVHKDGRQPYFIARFDSDSIINDVPRIADTVLDTVVPGVCQAFFHKGCCAMPRDPYLQIQEDPHH